MQFLQKLNKTPVEKLDDHAWTLVLAKVNKWKKEMGSFGPDFLEKWMQIRAAQGRPEILTEGKSEKTPVKKSQKSQKKKHVQIRARYQN